MGNSSSKTRSNGASSSGGRVVNKAQVAAKKKKKKNETLGSGDSGKTAVNNIANNSDSGSRSQSRGDRSSMGGATAISGEGVKSSSQSIRSKKEDTVNGEALHQSRSGNNDEIIPSISVSSFGGSMNAPPASASSVASNSRKISHHRHHSLGNLYPRDSSDSRASSRESFGQGNGHSNSGSRKPSMSRRSSHNTNVELPPSMVKMEPKSPILKHHKYSQSNNSIINNNESALTDDENDNEEFNNSVSIHRRTNSKNKLDIVKRPDSERSNSFSTSRSRRKSDTLAELSDQTSQHQPMTRSNSHASSLTSGNTTAYNTPLNSPGLFKSTNSDGREAGDYFSPNSLGHNHNHSSHDSSNEHGNGSGHHGIVNEIHDFMHSSKKSYMDSFPKITEDYADNYDGMNGKDDDEMMDVNGMKKKKPLKPINIDETIQKLLDAGYAAKKTKSVCLKNSEISQICQQAREMFLSQPPLLELSPPVKIVGDVHGQYADLLRLFTKCGFPPAANYLFLGDYVDRGKQSLETILLLLCYKIKYPENFFLLRGNHECANVTRVYGFYDECKRRCNIKTWKIFIDTFNTLPLAAIVTGKIFCVHGGLSPVLNSMDEIRHVSRPTDVPDFGLINDLLWSDPTDSPNEWEDNERGVSYCYNKVAINKFLNKFGFDLVCRAHMVVEDGYEFFNDRSLVTVFSAPNYCGEFDNWGAVMSVSEGLLCSFELLDPLDSSALKQVMKKGRQERKLANQQQQQLQGT